MRARPPAARIQLPTAHAADAPLGLFVGNRNINDPSIWHSKTQFYSGASYTVSVIARIGDYDASPFVR